MRPHPRIRKAVKWGGAVVCAVLLIAWIGSAFWRVGRYDSRVWVLASNGVIVISLWHTQPKSTPSDVRWVARPVSADRFDFRFRGFRTPALSEIEIPLWVPALLPVVPTVIAWRRDNVARCKPKGACPACGYDRAGLARAAACPECGSAREPT